MNNCIDCCGGDSGSDIANMNLCPGSGQQSDATEGQEASSSFKAWNYGDEASLYSIAEDSREEFMSEAARSRAGTDLASANNSNANNQVLANDPVAANHVVDIGWDRAADGGAGDGPMTDDEDEEEVRSGTSNEPYYGYHNPRRVKLAGAACLLCMAVVAIILGVTLSNREDAVPRGAVSDGVTVDEFIPPPTSTPSAIPSAAPNPSPVAVPVDDTTKPPTDVLQWIGILSDALVKEALDMCPGRNLLDDPGTPQGKVFKSIMDEIFEGTEIEEDGSFTLPLHMGQEYIQEKYALGMLYASTGGDRWDVASSWNTFTDPCEADWFGVINCKPRTDGDCAILYLNLSTYSFASPLTANTLG